MSSGSGARHGSSGWQARIVDYMSCVDRGSWIFFGSRICKTSEERQSLVHSLQGPNYRFSGPGVYTIPGTAQPLDLILGRGEANNFGEDKEAIKLEKGGGENGARLTYTKVPGVYSEAVTIFVTGAIFNGVTLHAYFFMLRIPIASARRFIFVGAAIKHSAYSAKHDVFVEWTALYLTCYHE